MNKSKEEICMENEYCATCPLVNCGCRMSKENEMGCEIAILKQIVKNKDKEILKLKDTIWELR